MDSVAHGSDHAHHEEHHEEHTSLGVSNLKLAFWVFLASDCFFFGSLIGTYMSYRGQSLVGPYPQDVFSVEITSISTFLLLMSSLTMVLAVRAAKIHQRSGSTKMAMSPQASSISVRAFSMASSLFALAEIVPTSST